MYCVDSWQIFFLSFPFCFDHRKKLVKGGELLHSLVHLPICSTTEVHYRTFAMLTYSRAVRPQQCRGLRSARHLKRVRSCWLCTNEWCETMCMFWGHKVYCGGLHYGMVQCVVQIAGAPLNLIHLPPALVMLRKAIVHFSRWRPLLRNLLVFTFC